MKNLVLLVLVVIIIILAVSVYKSYDLKRTYRQEVAKELAKQAVNSSEILTQEDIRHLPDAVQRYIIYTGALGKEKVSNMRIVTGGEFKTDRDREWAPIKTYQYNFFKEPARIYYLEMKMFGIPVRGLHSYSDAAATMLIKLAGLFTVAEGKGQVMNKAETVTVFNDMCLMAPASLIDERIQWEEIDKNIVKGTFTNKENTISAKVTFNDQGQLVNFVSNDRFYSPTGSTYEKTAWSTPISEYKEFNGMKLPSYGEAIWHFPEGDYTYAKLRIEEVEYNVSE